MQGHSFSAMTALSKASVSAQDTLEKTAYELVANAMVQTFLHAEKDVYFAAKELVTKFLDRVLSEAVENEFYHGTVAPS